MKAAMKAGGRGAPFPLTTILRECRNKWPELRRGQRSVARLSTQDDRRALVRNNAVLFLHIVQTIPFDLPPGREIDVEHLYPRALVDHMKWKGPKEKQRLQRHPGASDLLRAGNLYILDRTLNQSAGKKWPDEKLEGIFPGRLWPESLFLDPEDAELLKNACEHLRSKDRAMSERVPDGMRAFGEYVDRRELLIFEKIREQFPLALRFARRS